MLPLSLPLSSSTTGNCWLDGTIPVALRRLRKLRHINLSNNWLNGTLPAWLAELPRLRVLNLGSQFGDNPGREDGATGLVGTIPAELGQLASLRELNLEINALSGELPAQLCGNGAPLQWHCIACLLLCVVTVIMWLVHACHGSRMSCMHTTHLALPSACIHVHTHRLADCQHLWLVSDVCCIG
jgi:Leucine rich repeat